MWHVLPLRKRDADFDVMQFFLDSIRIQYKGLILQLQHSVSFNIKLPIQLSKVAKSIQENYFMGFPFKQDWNIRLHEWCCANNGPNLDLEGISGF